METTLTMTDLIATVTDLGFIGVRKYDVDEDSYYFDATVPSGERVEIQVELFGERRIQWRFLGLKDMKDLTWTHVGFLPTQRPPAQTEEPEEEPQTTNTYEQLALF